MGCAVLNHKLDNNDHLLDHIVDVGRSQRRRHERCVWLDDVIDADTNGGAASDSFAVALRRPSQGVEGIDGVEGSVDTDAEARRSCRRPNGLFPFQRRRTLASGKETPETSVDVLVVQRPLVIVRCSIVVFGVPPVRSPRRRGSRRISFTAAPSSSVQKCLFNHIIIIRFSFGRTEYSPQCPFKAGKDSDNRFAHAATSSAVRRPRCLGST